MDSKKFEGKRLLVLAGVNPIAVDVVRFARSMGAYVIVTGNLPVEQTPAKRYADEVSMVSTADIDALEQLVHEKKIDAVMTGSSEFALSMVLDLCKRLNMPFYCTREQWEICSNKRKFKDLCKQFDVPVVEEYTVKEAADGKDLQYPVIVKPVDSSGGAGISVCNTAEEFEAAYLHALDCSKSKNIVVEKYLSGDEIGINYAIQDGKIYLTAMHDRYLADTDDGFMRLPQAYVYPSKHLGKYQQVENGNVIRMFESIGLQHGSLFLQGFADNGDCSFYEMGYRMNGAKQYNILEEFCGFNTLKMLINQAMTGHMGEPDLAQCAQPAFKELYCTLSLLMDTGSRISKIKGLEEIAAMPEVVDVSPWWSDGQFVDDKFRGTQRQIACRVTLKAADTQKLAESIDRINALFDVLREDGTSMLLPVFDTARLFA